MKELERFDTAAQHHGWQRDQGVPPSDEQAAAEYLKAKSALVRALSYAYVVEEGYHHEGARTIGARLTLKSAVKLAKTRMDGVDWVHGDIEAANKCSSSEGKVVQTWDKGYEYIHIYKCPLGTGGSSS